MPLLNAFINSVACVGFTSERGVAIDSESKSNGSLFKSPLQASVLAIVNADRAMYPESRSSELIDPLYPPAGHTSTHSTSASSGRSTPISPLASNARPSRHQMISTIYQNLPFFCFPDGAHATWERENERIHHIVFTREDGKRTYALVFTFQQAFTLKTDKPDDDGIYQISDVQRSTPTARRPSMSKIPVAIDKLKSAIPTPTPLTTTIVNSTHQDVTPTPMTAPAKSRSRKMPSSFHFSDQPSGSRVRSTSTENLSKQPHYETPTFSSYMKNLSPSAAPPPARLSRTNSQTSLASLNDNTPNETSSFSRQRSTSNASHKIPTSTAPSTTTRSTTKPTTPMPIPTSSRTVTSNHTSTSVSITNSIVSSPGQSFDSTKPFYLPQCIVLLSNQPFWTEMQETMTSIHDELIQSKVEPNSNAYKLLIQKYAFFACNTPIPPIPWDRFSLSLSLTHNQSVLIFDPPVNTDRAVLDLDLSILLLTLNIGKLLDVLAAILTEQPIIFFSSNYSKLVTTLECLLYLIYPLKWAHIYVPLVPYGLRDHYLAGPTGSYIMGTHARHQEIVEKLDNSITCNLDNDKNIRVPKHVNLHNIPSTKLQRFIDPITHFLENIKVSRSLQNVHTPIRLRMDQQREFERETRIETNQKITKMFFDLMVDLCGDALKPIYWTVHHQHSPTNTLARTSNHEGKTTITSQTTTFSKENYLLSKSEGVELEFYQTFVETTAFQHLLEEERVSVVPSIFRQTCQIQLLSDEDQLYDLNHPDNPNDLATLCDSLSSQMILPLPNWPNNASTHYLDSCIDVFTNELQNAQRERSPAVIAVFAYLRGCAFLARGNLLDGLRDLYLIDNQNLFPREYIEAKIVPRLSDEHLLDIFTHESFYQDAPEWKKVDIRSDLRLSKVDLTESGNSFEESISTKSSSDFDNHSDLFIVNSALTYEQFTEHIQRLSITNDAETTGILFNALLYWTDSNLVKTLKKDKTLTSKTSNSSQSSDRHASISSKSLKDTLMILNDHRQGGQSSSTIPKLSLQTNSTTLPAALFGSFLDVWQQTNAEKVRMIRCLPDDRQKQESILKVSSSGVVSKKDGPGQIILTQKRLYFLPEARSLARLLTDLMNITSVHKYQHQTVFSSSKPGVKIHTSTNAGHSSLPRDTNSTLKSKSASLEKETKTSISLFFKSNHEQELWYTLIMELWSGLTIAHEECDTTVLNKAARHIALMDTLAHIEYDEDISSPSDRQSASSRAKLKQRHNETSRELALGDLSTFTRTLQDGTYKPLPAETRSVLTRRLSPSINEKVRHPVRCLVFVEQAENGRSSLWCSYGPKLKIFSVSTWICDPSDLMFPSEITCLCLDGRYKLWVGCIHGELFVVDTTTRTCSSQLTSIEGEGGCQTMVFNAIHNQILTANRASTVIIWNASSWERVADVNLCEIYKNTHDTKSRTFKSEAVVQFRNPPKSTSSNHSNQPRPQLDIPSMPSFGGPAQVIPSSSDKLERLQIYENLLLGCYCNDYILVLRIIDINTYTYEHVISVKYKIGDSTPIDSFLAYNKQLWVSTGCIIHIFDIDNEIEGGSYDLRMKKSVDDDHLMTMLGFSGYIWAGSLHGKVYVFRMDNFELYKTFAGHRDRVFCLCSMLDTYVVSGSAQNDTSIAIWENVQTTNGATASAISSAAKRALANSHGNGMN
ncbi:unnamed protein product [Adineta ricciae]|uniref:UDENN domain-containing protein n=1 Tax=Adineta ricciae TaxID=249248 RepID=A0A813WR58_ADIRI|nr:unnamed protein product [Adineta ricciae]CAF0854795.1 unnamed protein product [Adineta ricciae]